MSELGPQLFDALAFCPASSNVLSLSADVLQLRSCLHASRRDIRIDHYVFGREKKLGAMALDGGDRLVIAERGPWKPEYQPSGPGYDLVVADFSRVRSDLGAVVKSLGLAMEEKSLLSCSFPLGWRPNQDYPYFLSVENAIRIMGAHGLVPIEVSITRDNVKGGYACHLICNLRPDSATPPFDETRRLLKRYTFIPNADPSFEFSGDWGTGGGGERIARDTGASFTWRGEATEVLVVCEHHQWSGIGEFLVRGKRTTRNFYSWYGHTQPEEVFFSKAGPLAIRLAGRSIGAVPSSQGIELVTHGVLIR